MGQTASALNDDDSHSLDNVNFYTGKISSKPDGGKIDTVLKNWFGDWDLLEAHHGYVQWLFPIREGGLNFSAQPLSKNESDAFRKSPEIINRCLQSYELMLDFYGLVLVDKKTGVLARNPKTFKARLLFLNNSFHNYLRITRICKFLGIIGLEHFKKQFLRHLALEVFKYRNVRNAEDSCLKFWLPTLRNKDDLKELDEMVQRIIGKQYDRDKLQWHGDEQSENWATQFYPCECPEFITAPEEQVKTVQPPKDDVLTHDCDPFEEIHKKFEAKQHNFFSGMRRRLGEDEEDDEDDGGDVVMTRGASGLSANRSVLMPQQQQQQGGNNNSTQTEKNNDQQQAQQQAGEDKDRNSA